MTAFDRFGYLLREELTDEQHRLYSAIVNGPRGTKVIRPDGSLRGPLDLFLRHPSVGDPLQQLGAAVRYAGILDDRLRELSILVIASDMNVAHEWNVHSDVARSLGVDEATLEAIRTRGTLDDMALEAAEVVAVTAVRRLLNREELTEEHRSKLLEHVGEAGLVELIGLIGYYFALSHLLRTFER